MDAIITFTLSELITIILAICGGIVTISAAVVVIINAYKHSPNAKQNDRLSILEKRADSYDDKLDNDNKRLKEIEDGNRTIQHSILALLSHGIDGNAINEMREAKKELENYLISR